VQSGERQIFLPTTAAENASGDSRDLFMWRIGTAVCDDEDAMFGNAETKSGGGSGGLLMVPGDE